MRNIFLVLVLFIACSCSRNISVQETALFQAIRSNNVEAVKSLLSTVNPDFEQTSLKGSSQTPLLVAVAKGNKEIVKLLVENGANVNRISIWGVTAISEAARTNNQQVARFLLSKGADIEKKDKDGRTALNSEVWSKNIDAVNLLLDLGASPNTKDSFGRTPLMNIFYSRIIMEDFKNRSGNEVALVEIFKKWGADTTLSDSDGATYSEYKLQKELQAAIVLGNELMVISTISEGAKSNFIVQPICKAVEGNNIKILEILFDNGATIEAKCKSNYSLLLLATIKGSNEIIRLLLHKGAEAKTMDFVTYRSRADADERILALLTPPLIFTK
jgi:ankyrin repeat protein